MTMLGLVTNRTKSNVNRLNELAAKNWGSMTDEERAEWLGDPKETQGANLIPYGPAYSSSVELTFSSDAITSMAIEIGTWLSSVLIIGNASDYDGKIFTLSVGSITSSGLNPKMSLYWHDGNGYEHTGYELSEAGSVVVDLSMSPNTGNREYLALYVYVTQDVSAHIGVSARFENVMFEIGDTAHEYKPYVEIVPNNCTKGAYNYSDLNRVERAVAEISRIKNLSLVTKTDWGMWDIPTVADMGRYLYNVRAIRDYFMIETYVPNTMDHFTYVEANNIEAILSEAYSLATRQEEVLI